MRQPQKERLREDPLAEGESGIEEDIRSMLNQKPTSRGGRNKTRSTSQAADHSSHSECEELPCEGEEISPKSVTQVVRLLEQLSGQYDELEAHLKTLGESPGDSEVPLEFVASVVKSTKISPTLMKMVKSMADENRALRAKAEELTEREERARQRLDQASTEDKAKRVELKYMEQTLAQLSREVEGSRAEASAQKKRIVELEAAVEAQKRIAKELLREKSNFQSEIDVHEQEKDMLKKIIEEREGVEDKMKFRAEELEHDAKKLRRELEVTRIQAIRLKKRCDLKDAALDACNQEMASLIKQLEKLSRVDVQKDERLEYLSIIKKRLEAENKTLQGPDRPPREASRIPQKALGEMRAGPRARTASVSKGEEQPSADKTKAYSAAHPRAVSDSGTLSEEEGPVPSASFSQALEAASLPSASSDTESEGHTDKTTTSFQEMKHKTEEMTRKFKELDSLLQEIRRGNDSELEKVEEQVHRYSERK